MDKTLHEKKVLKWYSFDVILRAERLDYVPDEKQITKEQFEKFCEQFKEQLLKP